MRILFIGDVVGKPGRRAVATLVPALRKERGIDFVIANGENARHIPQAKHLFLRI